MDATQVACCVIGLALSILMDVLTGNVGHTLACLSVIAFVAVSLSYEYRKRCDEAEERKTQYHRKLRRK